jgi:hypothetical protein
MTSRRGFLATAGGALLAAFPLRAASGLHDQGGPTSFGEAGHAAEAA